jgi:hypothetical protein
MTTANTPQHNGVAECLNHTLLDKTRAMLINANLPDSYWLEALNHATLLHNVSPTHSLPSNITPAEAYTGTKLDVSQLQIFGCTAHVHVPEQARSKLSSHSMPCTFLGFAQNRSAFRLIHRPTSKFLESRDIIFDEGGHNNTQPIQPTQCHEHIILEPDNTPPTSFPDSLPSSPPSSRPKRIT